MTPRPVVGLARGGRYDEQQLKAAIEDGLEGSPAVTAADITAAWDRADPKAIHPARGISEAAYWESGAVQAEALATVLKRRSWIVDFGCGDGRVTVPLAERGFDVIGADASPNMLRRLRVRGPGIRTVSTDGTDLADRLGEQVDAVVCLAVLIHHDYDAAERIVRGLAAAVRPGGTLVLDWPTADVPHERGHWIDVTTWGADHRAQVAERIGLTAVGSGLPWSTWTTKIE